MDELSVDRLANCLEGHLPPDLIQILKDQKINGIRFMALNASTLKLFDFNLCHIIDIVKLIEEIKAGSKDIIVPACGEQNHNSGSAIPEDKEKEVFRETEDSDKSSESEASGASNVKASGHNSEEEKEVDHKMIAADKLLRQYVKPSYLKTLSQYELLNNQKICFNWLRAQEIDSPVSSAPPLAVPKSALLQPVDDKENSPPKKKNKSTKSARTSSRFQMLMPSKSNQEGTGGSSNLHNVASSSKFRHQMTIPEKETTDDEDVSDNDDGGSEPISADKMYKLPNMDHFQTGEQLKLLHPELPSFDVEDILLQNDKTKDYVPFLKDGYLFIEKIRKCIFRILVRHLCFKYVDNPTKLTKAMKEGLAKAIIVKFPQYQKLVVVANQSPWSHITAHIQNIYKRVLDKLPLADRPRKGKVQKKKKSKAPQCDIDVTLLALLNNVPTNREEILEGMKKSFNLRTSDRRKGQSITELLEKYPHLKHYHGEVLTLEFNLMHPKAVDMVRVFTPLVPKVLDKVHGATTLNPKCGLAEMKVFLYLASKLPHSIDKDALSFPDEQEIVETLRAGTKSVDEFVEEKRSKTRSAVQPYLIALQGNLSNNILKYFLILDSHPMELGNISFLRAADWLFKAYHVFNVHYPLSWRNFFRFLQTCVYTVFVDKKDDVIPSAQNLYSWLLSL